MTWRTALCNCLVLLLLYIASAQANTHGINAGESMVPGDVKISHNGKNKLVLQSDSICLYYNGINTWCAPGVSGHSIARLTMQDDGNLVAYDANGVALWYTNTAGHDGEEIWLAVSDDANLRLWVGEPGDAYDFWRTETWRFRWIDFENSGTGISVYPLLMNQAGTSEVWNGKWNGVYWLISIGSSKTVDFSNDLTQGGDKFDGRGGGPNLLAKPLKIGMSVVAGHDDWVNTRTFIYDGDSGATVYVKEIGSASNSDSCFNGGSELGSSIADTAKSITC